jgi:predicted phage terminase large subunit-like protein
LTSLSASSSKSAGRPPLESILEATSPTDVYQARQHLREESERQKIERDFAKLRREQSGRGSLLNFVRYFWHTLEPSTRKLVDGWPLEAICMHLEAVTFGDITRLLINVPPGFMKSLLTDVFWPAWEWGPMNMPHLRYVAFSYSDTITTRDNNKMVRLVTSPSYRQLWGDRFMMTKLGERRIENNMTGFKLASSAGGVGTGERGDRVILDDPHNVIQAESDLERTKTVRFFRESMSNRINDDRSAIVIIMQRLHENDVSGDILARESDYCHCMIPMYFEPLRYPASTDGERTEDPETGEPFEGNDLGWIDPRALDDDGNVVAPDELQERDGELAWPARFPPKVVVGLQSELGPYAYSGQYQQAPVPRKGGIFSLDYWQDYDVPERGPSKGKFPDMEFVLVSVDTSFTEKEENDPNGCTTWGIFRDQDDMPKVMLLWAWRKHLPIHGPTQAPRRITETKEAYAERCKPHWGLVEWIAYTCRRFGGADMLLIEAKGSGIDVVNEMKRLYGNETWAIEGIVPLRDKVSRALSVQPVFSQGLVYAPLRDWSDMVKSEMALFPKGRYKDLTDSATQALKWMRVQGLIQRPEDISLLAEARQEYRRNPVVLYRA